MPHDHRYTVLIEPLPEKEGGGFVTTVPDLPGCMSDGDTWRAAADNAADAIDSWKEEAREQGRPVPQPGAGAGQWRQRVPRKLHEKLRFIARSEGVSLNALMMNVLSEFTGKRTKGGSGDEV